ncbi:unnamed protein product [Linum tenue]|uniref:Uncharacterized protein n=1 Tax=Linum tenue TaxID=586396 RepID=A0AAV0INW8_9ROSI|nr:unnamed protein product [Linum tenue]
MSQSAAIAIPAAADGYEFQKPHNAKPRRRRDCCKSTFFIIFAVVLICAVPAVTRSLIYLQPSLPAVAVISSDVTVKNVSANSLATVKNVSSANSLVTASWDVSFSITNPNDDAFLYHRFVAYAAAADDGVRIANVTLRPFRQAGRGAVTLSASFPSLNFVVDDDCAATNRTILKPCGPVPLMLEVEASAVYERRMTWPRKGNVVEVVCDPTEVTFRPNVTRLELGPSSCRADGEWRRLVVKCWAVFRTYIFFVVVCVVILGCVH